MITWAVWALLLLAQAGSNTWVSRARNSGSLRYHAAASACSNGVWFASLFLIVDQQTRAAGDPLRMVATGAFYVACTMAGSVGMHHLLHSRVERGAMRVGA